MKNNNGVDLDLKDKSHDSVNLTNVHENLHDWTAQLKLEAGEEQIANEDEKLAARGHDTKGRFMKGNPGKPKGSRSKLTQRMLDHAASLPMTPEEVMASLFSDSRADPELCLKAAKVYGDWVYYKAPNIEVVADVEFDSAASIEEQVDLFLERSEEDEQKNKFSRIRKFGFAAAGMQKEDFEAFIEAYGDVPVGKIHTEEEHEEAKKIMFE